VLLRFLFPVVCYLGFSACQPSAKAIRLLDHNDFSPLQPFGDFFKPFFPLDIFVETFDFLSLLQ